MGERSELANRQTAGDNRIYYFPRRRLASPTEMTVATIINQADCYCVREYEARNSPELATAVVKFFSN
jgi:hypothetical protein